MCGGTGLAADAVVYLRAQLAAAQADTARLDWLEENARHRERRNEWCIYRIYVGFYDTTLRAAIDAAKLPSTP